MKKTFLTLIAIACLSISFTYVAQCEDCLHIWSDWEIYDEPNCTYTGSATRHCEECFEYEEKKIPATGVHVWNDWELTEEPTCTDDGREERMCSSCYITESRPIKAIGKHTWGNWITYNQPNCMNEGEALRHCEKCFEEQTKTLKINPSNHEYGQWYVSKKSTAFDVGTKERECIYCQKIQKSSLPKLKQGKVSSKAEKEALKTVTNFLTYSKTYDVKKIQSCFTDPKKVQLFIKKKKMASFFRTYNKKYIEYKLKYIKVSKNTATVYMYCKYYDAYESHQSAIWDLISYLNKYPKASTSKIDKYQYNRLVKWNKTQKKTYSYKTVKFILKKVGKNWKISSFTKDMDNLIHSNYTKAYDSIFN